METTDTIVIGAGQAGLAMSRCLAERGVDHVVLDRGRVGERWRTERWDSLRLLTPNWMTRLPGRTFGGDDPDGFMTARELVSSFESYARSFDAPVRTGVTVAAVRRRAGAYEIDTTAGSFAAANVVVATGWCDRPAIPALARHLPSHVHQLTPSRYRRPADVASGGVLVVGASASGAQLADELVRAGREVTLAVGRHTRLPRRYRGMDVFWWLERTGRLDRTIDDERDAERARREPSLQLAGRPDGRAVDLPALQRAGVRLAGRLIAVDGHRAAFARDLPATTGAADRRLRRLLAAIDRHIDASGLAAEVLPAPPPAPPAPDAGLEDLDLRRVATVVWATGYQRSYPWLHVPVLDESGEIRHRRGVTPAPGLYVLGQRFQHTRRSTFIDGAGADAAFVADHLTCRHRHPAHPAHRP